jgi:hypothetical protein
MSVYRLIGSVAPLCSAMNDPQYVYSLNRDEGAQIIQAIHFRPSHDREAKTPENVVGSLGKGSSKIWQSAGQPSWQLAQRKLRRDQGSRVSDGMRLIAYCGSGMVSRIPPMTSIDLKSFFGLLGCALWQPTQD